MKVVILAGGFGTRIAEYTETIPKPMVPIGGRPILWHIMQTYAKYNFKDFYIALGYKGELIKDYFLNYRTLNSNFTVELNTGSVYFGETHDNYSGNLVDWRVTLVDTGSDSMTGGRLKRMKSYVGNETFMLTYGDGVADINLEELLNFHRNHGKMVTVSAVRPSARFGELELDGSRVEKFKEKPQTHDGWINGGYFIIEPIFFDLILGDKAILEGQPLEVAAQMDQLRAYKHNGYWQCMDTKRDRDLLEQLFLKKEGLWKK